VHIYEYVHYVGQG